MRNKVIFHNFPSYTSIEYAQYYYFVTIFVLYKRYLQYFRKKYRSNRILIINT